MSDLVKRLRKGRSANEWVGEELAHEAADEIDRLREALEKIKKHSVGEYHLIARAALEGKDE